MAKYWGTRVTRPHFLAEVQGNRQVNGVSWGLLGCIQAEFQVFFQGEHGWRRLYE